MKFKLTHLLMLLLVIVVLSNACLYPVKEGMGVKYDDIPDGDDDLYILKSQVVPPVCPKCPDVAACPRQKPCAPCPPCGRCPEPAFRCKKVPNYKSRNESKLPMPMLNTFAAFR